jgi:hypothetical protein
VGHADGRPGLAIKVLNRAERINAADFKAMRLPGNLIDRN